MKKELPHNLPTNGTSKHKKICFVAGMSGGHIIPCLTLATQYKKNNASILFITSNRTLDQNIVRNHTAIDQLQTLSCASPKRYVQWLLFPFRFLYSFFKSLFILMRFQPDTIITTGSIVALPVCYAGWLLRIPIELYELNVIPGMATRALAPFATKLCICFADTQKHLKNYSCTLTQYPIRFTKPLKKIKNAKPTLFIQGGSQGSHQINRAIKNMFESYPELSHQIAVIHQTGNDHSVNWKSRYEKRGIDAQVFSFSDNLAPYYQSADLIICRAGAGQLFEALFFETPCITIPLILKNNNHQLYNAQAMAKRHPQLFTTIDSITHTNIESALYNKIVALL